MRSWRTRPGEPIRGIPPGSQKLGQGFYQGRPQWLYKNDARDLWFRITQMSDGTFTIEEYTQAEIDDVPCGGCSE